MDHSRPRIRDYPAGTVHGQAVIDFGGYLFRGVAIINVVNHSLREDPRADNDRVTRNLAWIPFNILAVGPIDIFDDNLGGEEQVDSTICGRGHDSIFTVGDYRIKLA